MDAAAFSALFSTWVENGAGHISPKLDLFNEMPTGDRGVVASRNIAKGEQIMLLPLQRVLHLPSLEDFKKNPSMYPAAATQFLLEHTPALSAFTGTVLLLLAEYARGKQSPFREYIMSLPEEVDCLLTWSKEDKAELDGTSIDDAGREQTQAFFAREALPVVSARPDLWPAPWDSLSSFARIAGIVQSRAFHMEEQNWVTGSSKESTNLYLLPAVDMINHASDASRRNAVLSRVTQPMSKVVGGEKQTVEWAFCVTAECDIPAGSEVLHSYGDLSDAALLQTYGFVDGQPSGDAEGGSSSQAEPFVNPANHVLVPFQSVLAVCRLISSQQDEDEEAEGGSNATAATALEVAKVELLSSCRLLQPAAPGNTEFVLSLADPLPDTLLTVIQVMLMMEEDFSDLQDSVEDQTVAGVEPSLSLGFALLEEDAEFADLVAMSLVQVLDQAVKRYPTSVDQDLNLLANAEGFRSLRHFYAVSVRLGEKQILSAASKAVVEMIIKMPREGQPSSVDDDDEDEDESDDDDEEGEDDESEENSDDVAPSRKRRKGLGAQAIADQDEGDDEDDAEDAPDSDDSDKVGYGAGFEYDDGPGEGHDRGKAHSAPANGKPKK